MSASPPADSTTPARGRLMVGLIIGVLLGLAIALAVALTVNNGQLPFNKKMPLRSAEQDAAEAQRNQNWNPNAALGGRQAEPPPLTQAPNAQASSASGLPAGLILPSATELTAPAQSAAAPEAHYEVQAGAFRRQDEAEHQRARLQMMDLQARVTLFDQAGQTIYRVRLGPMEKSVAQSVRTQLELEGIDASLVVVKPN